MNFNIPKQLFTFVLLISLGFLFSCAGEQDTDAAGEKSDTSAVEETTEEKNNTESQEENNEAFVQPEEIKSFKSPSQLMSAVLQAMNEEDFQRYATYVLPEERIEEMAEKIEDDQKRKALIKEMRFSHKEEKIYFMNLINKLKQDGVKLDNIPLAEVDIFPYEQGKYKPLQLKEVLIDITLEEKEEIFYIVAIKDGEKWYATSEIGL